MPVNTLCCEGNSKSPDVRVLSRVLAGLCEVRPFGSKHGMGDRILARREVTDADKDKKNPTVYGVLDGDYAAWQEPEQRPRQWNVNNGNVSVHTGWRWERKEIENYLIDPAVVERALGRLPERYIAALETAASQIASYQAARIALTLNRPHSAPLQNSFGKLRGRGRHPMPEDLGRDQCLHEAKQLVHVWNSQRQIGTEALDAAFITTESECSPDGVRGKHFMTSFAGKDLLWAMEDYLNSSGFGGPTVFLERILTRLGDSTEVWDWLPEWRALRQAVTALP
jgi:hypothetical protein